QEQRRSTVDVEHRVELRGLELEEWRDDATGGVADEQPDLETGDRLADRVDEVGTGEMEGEGPDLDGARDADLGSGALEGLAVPVEKDEVEAVPRDLPRPLGPETDRGAGDERTRTVARAELGDLGHGRAPLRRRPACLAGGLPTFRAPVPEVGDHVVHGEADLGRAHVAPRGAMLAPLLGQHGVRAVVADVRAGLRGTVTAAVEAAGGLEALPVPDVAKRRGAGALDLGAHAAHVVLAVERPAARRDAPVVVHHREAPEERTAH